MNYVVTKHYPVVARLRISELLRRWPVLEASYFIEHNGDIPSFISSNRDYLESLNKNRKVTLLDSANITYNLEHIQ